MSDQQTVAPSIDLAGVHLQFDGVRVLEGVSMTIDRECVALIGPNGAGKTSLVNVVTGFYKPDAGSVRILGRDTAQDRPEEIGALGVARTFQTPQVMGGSSVLSNVLLGLHRRTRSAWWSEVLLTATVRRRESEAWERAYAALDLVGLRGHAAAPADTLSLGERRLLEIARAIAGEPRLLLLDEPASGLAEHEVTELIGLIADLRRQRDLAVLVVEHSMTFVRRVVDRVVVLDQGAVIADGGVAQTLADPIVVAAYLGDDESEGRAS